MKVKRIIPIFLIVIFITVSTNGPLGGTSNGGMENQKIEVIQAAKNYKLGEEVFLHDYNEKVTRQEVSMLMVVLLEKLSYKNIKTVAQVIQILYAYTDKPKPTPIYIPHIYLASKAGIIESESKNRFNPFGLVTRQMFAAVLLKAMLLAKPFNKFDIKEDVNFLDNNKIFDWAKPGVTYSYKNNYLEASAKNEINPKGYLTREQALEIIYKVLIKEKAITRLSETEIKRAKGEMPLLLVKSNEGKWGFSDNSGKILINTQYDNANNFKEGLAAVSKNGKWGFIDSAGNSIGALEYDHVQAFYNEYAAVNTGTKFGYIDNTGKVKIKLQYYYDNEFTSDLYHFENGSTFVKIGVNQYRLIDKTGKALYSQAISYARPFSDELAAIKVNNRFCYIDDNGKIRIRLDPEVTSCSDFKNGSAEIYYQNNLYHYIDKKGKVMKGNASK